jgi:aspartokinase-like uncharacterized kinase
MWVVKLGGSLARSPDLPSWLRALAGRPGLVLVPGGGPFADQVRAAQAHWGFPDAAAHEMALLAMEQYGRMLCALQSGLRPAASAAELRDASPATPVWMPTRMVMADPEMEHCWDVTSDSLAAWLCRRLGAEGLLLVKSAPAARLAGDRQSLSAQGIVDLAFPRYAKMVEGPVRFLSKNELARLDEVLPDAPAPTP